jgi:hypothetical protein
MTDSTRPPNKPPSNPPPSGPPPSSPPSKFIDDLMLLADSLGFQTPARQSPQVCATGGPAQSSGRYPERLTPSSAVAVAPAACESTDPPSGAGVDVPGVVPGCKGRVVGAVGAAAFTLPDTRVPLRFGAGEHRLVGVVEALLTPDS